MGSLQLNPEHVIELWTQNGLYRIEMLFGDITKLPREEKVDIIMVSAFPGDYSPMSGTVLGALKKNLGVNLMNLSNEKDLDLRHHFSCWLTRPLINDHPHLPFNKVLCFESRRTADSVTQQISQMFRVFVPVFNNTEHSVITPLLATGHQGRGKSQVLGAMIESAASWILAGLPLKVLKIVVYGNFDDGINTMFTALKTRYLKKNEALKNKILKKAYDVCLTFNPVDKTFVDAIKEQFQKLKPDVKLYIQSKEFKEGQIWQDEIFSNMVACKKIVTVLTPNFMESSECLDQYNMAMCCNQLFSANVLSPFYVDTIKTLPSYMGLVQWIDCRIRKEGDTTHDKIREACSMVIESLDKQPSDAATSKTIIEAKLQSAEKFQYDVFISYSHRNPQQAELMLEIFKHIDPLIKVFYDRSALTTGVNWQNMLYQSVGECQCMVALISPNYLTSTVCTEEFNLAFARHLCKDKGMRLIPVLIEGVNELPEHISECLDVKHAAGDFKEFATGLASEVVDWLKSEESEQIDPEEMTVLDIYDELEAWRCSQVKQKFQLSFEEKMIAPIKNPNIQKRQNIEIDESVMDIAIIYANDTVNLVGTFCSVIDKLYPGLNISLHTAVEQTRLSALDKAKCIVLFISQQFLQSDAHMQELHLVLNRQRSLENDIIYLIKAGPLHGRPFFPRILKYDLVLSDDVWADFQKSCFPDTKPDKKVVYCKKSRFGHAHTFRSQYKDFFAVLKAVYDVLEFLLHPDTMLENHGALLVNLKEHRRKETSQEPKLGKPVSQHGSEEPVSQTVEHKPESMTTPADNTKTLTNKESDKEGKIENNPNISKNADQNHIKNDKAVCKEGKKSSACTLL
ncbi:uncharacterized protein LOC128209084 [Mya arenaria]|uniref:uncharacterized protein LOC128209084 n=1 Tax=Mya arenaria TaxID=6604 RepID=UPI0022E131DF|nr:uncharacterized protein LOC128209084 [Mya arenaria]XP_052768890.1 uncharacterized protein LOC128209084 [Mya arenaria]XP_052768891.1 uncharacterized protein LOC128209084 [Mya arenaria]XP_052768892.1 uncharacterized protein LOC128209084 [Mya arenaria]